MMEAERRVKRGVRDESDEGWGRGNSLCEWMCKEE